MLLALSGCVSVESLIKEGNYNEAEEAIASKKGTDRQSGYLVPRGRVFQRRRLRQGQWLYTGIPVRFNPWICALCPGVPSIHYRLFRIECPTDFSRCRSRFNKVLWSKSFPSTEDARVVAYDEKAVVFLSNDEETKMRMLIAIDPSTGKQLWGKTVAFSEPHPVIVVSYGLNLDIIGITGGADTFITLERATGRVVLSTQIPKLKKIP